MAVIEDVISRAYDFGALSATEDGELLYRSRGWEAWRGPLHGLTTDGIVRTEWEDGAVHVFPGRAPSTWMSGSPATGGTASSGEAQPG